LGKGGKPGVHRVGPTLTFHKRGCRKKKDSSFKSTSRTWDKKKGKGPTPRCQQGKTTPCWQGGKKKSYLRGEGKEIPSGEIRGAGEEARGEKEGNILPRKIKRKQTRPGGKKGKSFAPYKRPAAQGLRKEKSQMLLHMEGEECWPGKKKVLFGRVKDEGGPSNWRGEGGSEGRGTITTIGSLSLSQNGGKKGNRKKGGRQREKGGEKVLLPRGEAAGSLLKKKWGQGEGGDNFIYLEGGRRRDALKPAGKKVHRSGAWRKKDRNLLSEKKKKISDNYRCERRVREGIESLGEEKKGKGGSICNGWVCGAPPKEKERTKERKKGFLS